MQKKTGRRRAPPRVHSIEGVDVPTPLGDATFEASVESDAEGVRMRLSTGDLAEVIAAAVERIRRRQSGQE